MRKWIIGLAVLLVVLVAGVYALIPAKLVVGETAAIGAHQNTIYRCLTSAGSVRHWLKKEDAVINAPENRGVTVTSKHYVFTLAPQMFNIVAVDMGKEKVRSYITILALEKDSSLVMWKAELPRSHHVLARVENYLLAKKIKNNMAAVLQQFAGFMQNKDLVYGLKIQNATVTDTMLVTTKMRFATYPTPQQYYQLIQKLQQHIAQHGAQETNYPMLNITPTGDNQFETTVAIPVNKVIPSGGAVAYKRMIPGNILVAEVTGGRKAIETGFAHLENYMMENSFVSPAIPFQSLVTNRLAEQDSAKWVTRLYYPVL